MRYVILIKETTSKGTECKFEEYNSLEETLHRFNSLANISDNIFSNAFYSQNDNVQITKYYEGQRIIAYKAFNSRMKCREFQYAEGKTFTIDETPELCIRGFHACLNPLSIFSYYYGKISDLKFHKVYFEGDLATNPIGFDIVESKIVANKITIGEELSISQLFDEFNKFVRKQEETTDN